MISRLQQVQVQPKLTVNAPDDEYEREADQVAEAVMRAPEEAVQRKCKECEEEEVQRKPAGNAVPAVTPEVQSAVDGSRGGGRPLAESARRFFEPRLGSDLSGVRVHTDAGAGDTANSLSAAAFTVGSDIYFAPGRFEPDTESGRRLLAHELVHTVQQRNAVQRQLRVEDPFGRPPNAPAGTFNADIVGDYVNELCSLFTVDMAGDVVPTEEGFCIPGVADFTSTPKSCNCLCEMQPTNWRIVVDDEVFPHTHDNPVDPQFETIKVLAPFSDVELGAWSAGDQPHRINLPGWRVLAHELCGHAREFEQGVKPETEGDEDPEHGRPTHDPTVKIENELAAEHGAEARGLFCNPHHGESFGKVTLSPFPSGAASVFQLPATERQRKFDFLERLVAKTAADAEAQLKVDVIGHADQPATSEAVNERVSKQRALSARAEMLRRNIPVTFMETTGVGSSECSAAGDQPECRKVEIFLFGQVGASIGHEDTDLPPCD
jgi:hypothetical protein